MFEYFTEFALQTMQIAEKRALHVGHIGVEHLLFALSSQTGRIAFVSLNHFGITQARVESELDKIESAVSMPILNNEERISFTPQSKQALILAWNAARDLNHNYVSTEHILLGLLRQGEGGISKILEHLEVDIESLEEYVLGIVLKKIPFESGREEDGCDLPPFG